MIHFVAERRCLTNPWAMSLIAIIIIKAVGRLDVQLHVFVAGH